MKRFTIILSVIFFTVFATNAVVQAQSFPNDLSNALKRGNAEVIANQFSDNVEIILPQKSGVFSKTQAQFILSDFFQQNTPSDFWIIHQGSKESASFFIGNLKTSRGVYRTYFLIKSNKISQLRLETSD